MSAAAMLPPLREELTLHDGAADHDGTPTWMLHDPLRNQYFRLSWPAFEVLSRWHLADPQAVAQAVSAETTLRLEPEDVDEVVTFLARGQLLKPVQFTDVGRLLAIHDAQKTSWVTWLLHHYLFFRLPLLRPDRMLESLLPYLAWLGGRGFRLATVLALIAGLFLIGRQWSGFAATMVDHFSMEGLAAFGIALGLAKLIHELGHALTAKAFGCRVPTMGIAFLVMMPVLYTDVNEAWKLTSRRKRLLIGGAGILAELALAVWATLAWGVLPEGNLKGMAFTLAATTWISSLAINLSPFMRFDGYFLAMDALGQPNLHPRSFALARWHLREMLFGLDEPVPEHLPPALRAWMIAFAWAVWIYRLTLFLGIAALVYHVFIKVLGIILFAVEMGWFVARPFLLEFGEWRKRAKAIRASRRSRWPLGFALLALLVLAAPWSGRVSAPAMLKAAEHVTLYTPSPGRLDEIQVKPGDTVAAGTVLARLDNPDLELRLQQVERRIMVLKYEVSAMGFEDSFRNRLQAITQELDAAQAEKVALIRDRDRLTLTAPISGTVTDLSPNTQTGQWISPKEAILSLRKGAVIEAYLAEDDLPRIRVGGKASFIPDGSGAPLAATIATIDHAAVRALADPQLGAPYGGAIPARFDTRSLVPDMALYRIRLTLNGSVAVPIRGTAHMDGERRSILGRAWRSVAAVIIREMGM
ncbi:HlyD family efflux transporter periplasmic adaptor subunit [Magnetospirillum sp. 15-1]|uniref:HlyD family efflux transporter periplasmic adaptor subunit n=1 Tax=Magnetospirillum sp. 15-1 TaxID=1979370 RepID=UPI000BBC0BB9|nr:HlyD family efflux transporter periplasmic adaptor subunit [Magnetospirillum sp. 15-1]